MGDKDLSFGEVIAEEMEKGVEEINLQDLASQEDEPSLEQMRELLGEDGKELSDEDLQKMWDDTKGEGETVEGKVDEDGKPVETPEEGKGVEEVAPEPLTFEKPDELFDHKLTLTIDGQQREGTVAEFLRMAQRNPMQERRLQEVTGQRNELSTENERLTSEAEKAEQDFKWVKWMLEDESGARFLEMRQKFQAGQFQGPEVAAPVESGVSSEDSAQQYYQTEIRPVVQGIVRNYSQDGKASTAEEAQWLERKFEEVLSQKLELEGKFLTMQRLQDLVYDEIPQMIEQEGWRKVEGTPVAAVAPVANPVRSFHTFNDAGQVVSGDVSPELNAVKAELANLRRDMTKAKLAAAPGSGGEGGVVNDPNASFADRVGKADSAAAVFDLLNDEQETFGM